jgi:hypothetical protein
MQENEISYIIIASAIKVHRALGPGLLESVYEAALYHELKFNCGLEVKRQYPVEVFYEGVSMGMGFRADLIVEDKVIIEVKSVSEISKVFKKILYSYLVLSDINLGLLLNFNEVLLKDGIQRIVNNLEE